MNAVNDPYALSTDAVAGLLSVSVDHGLSEREIKKRRELFGRNELKKTKKKNLLHVLITQFKSPVVYLLLAAAVISFFFQDLTEAVAILTVIFINAAIGFWMEFQAVKSMDALRKLDVAKAKVRRSGIRTEIPSEDVVPGDIILVEAGDLISADARVLSTVQLEVDESTLTGESLPVVKNIKPLPGGTLLADRVNMIFKGTIATSGNGAAIVTGTGMETELGKISAMVETAKDETLPLNEKLEKFSKKLIVIALIVVLPLLGIGLLEDRDIQLMIKTSIALAVAAIPEGLPIVATIALARGMLKLAGHNVIVKKLAAVETLGSTNIIFTDKTGTLTENRLEVDTVSLPHDNYKIEWDEVNKNIRFEPGHIDHRDNENLHKLLIIAAICNNASFTEDNVTGDPLEVALLKIGEYHQNGFLDDAYRIFPRISERPFDSETRIMGTVHESGGSNFAAVKGAAEEVIKLSTSLLKNGKKIPFTENDKMDWLKRNEKLGKDGLRVLAFAYKDDVTSIKNFMHDLVFVGMTGFLDPPREEVKQSMRECHEAGIQVIMVTGDQAETAKHIAFRIGLTSRPEESVIHGRDLKAAEELTPEDEAHITKTKIFSRVSPKQKLELVDLYQKRGWIVGMTGDGVNDAPALKKADIGIAMGLRGTQVAREAADMVLQDDSFASIAKAVKYGRVIYDNIRTFIVYLLSCNLSEILIVALAGFTNLTLPLQPMQILFLNIVTDVFPALALGMNEGNVHVMKRRPKDPREPMINRKNWISIFVYSLFITTGVFAVFLYSHFFMNHPPEISNNIAFFSLAFAQLLHPLNLASTRVSFISNEVTRNPHLWMAVAFCTLLILLAYFIPPFYTVLSLQSLSPDAWVLIGVGSVLHLFLIQLTKRMRLIE